MDHQPLVEEYKTMGRDLLSLLDTKRHDIRAALWLYMPDLEEWKLIFGLPNIATSGPIDAYKSIINDINTARVNIDRRKIYLIDINSPIIKMLSTLVHTERDTISSISFSNNNINGINMPDSYIYRLAN